MPTLSGMPTWYTPAENQGQIITVSYRWDPNGVQLQKRVEDQADQTTSYYELTWERNEALLTVLGHPGHERWDPWGQYDLAHVYPTSDKDWRQV